MYVLKGAKAAAWILNLLQTIISPGLFCCLHIGALTAEALVGRILPVQPVELCAAAAASQDLLLPPAAGNAVCWCWDGTQEVTSPCSGEELGIWIREESPE